VREAVSVTDREDVLRVLGKRIRRLREARGWSQEELARRCGRHFTYIGRVERGQQNATLGVLLEVASALGAPLSALLSEEHPLLVDWGVTAMDVVEAVAHGFRAQVDVKGKLAEWMLFTDLERLRSEGAIQQIEWLDADDKPDFIVTVGGRHVVVECKNVRSLTAKEKAEARVRVELQKTRNAQDGSNTRGYRVGHFDILSACLFNRTRQWTFVHAACNRLATRPDNPSYLKVMQPVPTTPEPPWHGTVLEAVGDLEP
jgi:transcriptional regulator with XRE-family HTH domain